MLTPEPPHNDLRHIRQSILWLPSRRAIIGLDPSDRAPRRQPKNALPYAERRISGDPAPSPDDTALTRRLVEAGRLIGVDVLDHILIGDGRYVSVRERGWL